MSNHEMEYAPESLCPTCHPEKAPRLWKKRKKLIGGYSPLPRCEKHTNHDPQPPEGNAGVARAR